MNAIEKISQTLLINGTLTVDPGLYHGKTGIAVFFLHYARFTGNDLYHRYAMDLIEGIMQQLSVTSSAQYDTGMAGIGVGFEYVLQNGLIEADDNEIFEDFDARMYRAAMYEPYPDLTMQEGLPGWGRYFIYRLLGSGHKNNQLHEALRHIVKEIAQNVMNNTVAEIEQPDVYRFLCDLTAVAGFAQPCRHLLQQCRKWKSIQEPDVQSVFPCMSPLLRLYTCQRYFNMDLSEAIAREWEKWKQAGIISLKEKGLLNGWAREGMLYLTHFHNHDNSWMKLL